MAGRGMGAASRGGGAVGKGPKNKMVSEPSKSTGKVLMMAKGGYVPKGAKVSKFRNGTPLPPDRSTGYSGRPLNIPVTPQTIGSAANKMLTAVSMTPTTAGKIAKGVLIGQAAYPYAKQQAQAFYDDFSGDMGNEARVAPPPEVEGIEYRRGGAVRKKDYLKKKASMMRKGGVADKKGRAMKSKSKDSRGRAMRG